MSAENVAVIKGIYEGFAAGDVPAVVAAMSPDIEWNEAENFPLFRWQSLSRARCDPRRRFCADRRRVERLRGAARAIP
jgi:hypothetical protein